LRRQRTVVPSIFSDRGAIPRPFSSCFGSVFVTPSAQTAATDRLAHSEQSTQATSPRGLTRMATTPSNMA